MTRSRRQAARRLASRVLVLALSACAHGGSGESAPAAERSSPSQPAEAAPTPPPPEPAPTPTPVEAAPSPPATPDPRALPAAPAAEPAPVPTASGTNATASTRAVSVGELRKQRKLAAGSALEFHGYVILHSPCGSCPPNAACKPCIPALNVAARRDGALGDSIRLQFVGAAAPQVSAFRVGEKYVFQGTLSHWADDAGMPFAYVNYTGHARGP